MEEAWFQVEQSKYVTLVAFSALVALLSPLISKGTHRTFVVSVWMGFAGIGAVLLGLALVAYLSGQPEHVTSTLMRGGFPLIIAFGISFIGVLKGYREAEMRKVMAQEM